ncbi:2-hydroxy-3-oxopropionate reductase [Mycolicibacterium madagascariense]|uniref:2-hydroxy-3-oxopropionate reductase n=1 Tax=Mycolicibacterium madagascariense TaxID=212765 RepID=A0A7I7XE28_9MYCO|nr:NAD(P)-binding domain-containing protein [Mycolicibacterium madagascariense]BBZ27363.1 2-hydroxy-3-oxopropionate reductase [Mycolicibacterium madagascariense]
MTTDSDIAAPESSPTALRAGVIGLGMIGGGVAVSLARHGRTPAVYDIRPDATDGLPGVEGIAPSPADVARDSDVVVLAVVDADQAREVLSAEDGVLAAAHPGLIVVLLSTVAVPVVYELARECANHGVTLLDCGVTQAVPQGLVAMLGGDDATVARAMPVLSDFAKDVVHCGPLGAGMATKIARNVITYGTWRAVHEAATLVESAGVDPRHLIEAVHAADPEGSTLFSWLRNQLAGEPDTAAMVPQVQRLMDKDLAAAQELAARSDIRVPLVDAARANGRDTLTISLKETP